MTQNEMAYFCPNLMSGHGDLDTMLVHPTLKIMQPNDVFNQLFEAAGYSIAPSDKGKYHQQCVDRFGDMAAFGEFLKVEVNRSLLLKYLEQTPSTKANGVYINGRRYLGFDCIHGIIGAEATAIDLLADLIERRVMRRGFIFQCEYCSNCDWYAIEDVTTQFRCQRCLQTQVYTQRHWKQPQEPKWYYQLDEVVYQAIRNNVHLPILTLLLLSKEAKNSFYYVPEVLVKQSPQYKKQLAELDICCCLDGCVLVGEVKTASQLGDTESDERDALNKYQMFSDAIGAERVILITFQSA